jgi:hypothetical protein
MLRFSSADEPPKPVIRAPVTAALAAKIARVELSSSLDAGAGQGHGSLEPIITSCRMRRWFPFPHKAQGRPCCHGQSPRKKSRILHGSGTK